VVTAGGTLAWCCAGWEGHVLEETQEREEIIERVAALDIGKATLVCCVRLPNPARPGRRLQELDTYPTMTRSLLRLADRLRELGVTRVVMEATSDYWKPVFYVLESAGFQTWLVNARDVKHLPGRPKTDLLTELRRGSGCSGRQVLIGLSTFSGRDGRRGRGAGSVPVGGCSAWVVGGHRGSVRAVSAR
jgi:hypothetical protein